MLKAKCPCGVDLTLETAWIDRRRNRLQSKCKVCQKAYADTWRAKNKDRERARAKAYYHRNKNRLKVVYERSRVIRKYGVTLEQIAVAKEAQNYLCAICVERKATDTDHCHTTGKFRAILCGPCNTSLGAMQDRIDWLESAIAYLKKHGK